MNEKEINEDFDREYEKYKNSPDYKEGFVTSNMPQYYKIKMPTYYIAKHSDEDLQAAIEVAVFAERLKCSEDYLNDCVAAVEAAILAEREACIKLLEDFSKTDMVPVKDTWKMGLIAGANAIRARGNEMKEGIALESIAHPEGDPVPDDHEINPDSLEAIEIHIPVMPEDQLETWMHNMIRACNRSTCDSDINVLKLIQHIENLYEQGRADEREACAKLCEDLDRKWNQTGVRECAKAIRGRTE